MALYFNIHLSNKQIKIHNKIDDSFFFLITCACISAIVSKCIFDVQVQMYMYFNIRMKMNWVNQHAKSRWCAMWMAWQCRIIHVYNILYTKIFVCDVCASVPADSPVRNSCFGVPCGILYITLYYHHYHTNTNTHICYELTYYCYFYNMIV